MNWKRKEKLLNSLLNTANLSNIDYGICYPTWFLLRKRCAMYCWTLRMGKIQTLCVLITITFEETIDITCPDCKVPISSIWILNEKVTLLLYLNLCTFFFHRKSLNVLLTWNYTMCLGTLICFETKPEFERNASMSLLIEYFHIDCW